MKRPTAAKGSGFESDPVSQQTSTQKVEIEDEKKPGKWPRRWELPKSVGHLSKWRDQYRWAIIISVQDGLIGHGEAVLAHVIADRAGPRGVDVKGLTYQQLGEAVGRCPRQVATYLKNLAGVGLVIWHHNMVRTPQGQVKQRPNTYRPVIPAALAEKMQQLRVETRRSKRQTDKTTKQGPPPTRQHRYSSPSSKVISPSFDVVIVGAPPEPLQEASIEESRRRARLNLRRSRNGHSDQDRVP